MHSQLLSPDTLTPFRSHHDVLARLLPYHIYAEPEPPPAAVEKGLESCAFVYVLVQLWFEVCRDAFILCVCVCVQLMQCLRVLLKYCCHEAED